MGLTWITLGSLTVCSKIDLDFEVNHGTKQPLSITKSNKILEANPLVIPVWIPVKININHHEWIIFIIINLITIVVLMNGEVSLL